VFRSQTLNIASTANWPRKHRPAARNDINVNTGHFQRDNDVAKEDSRINAMPTHRLQRNLCCHGGVETGIKHCRPLP
jgi:hypothetical protein